MGIICRDILKNWTDCWQGAMISGIMFTVFGRQMNKVLKRYKPANILFFADGIFLYYLLYVTLFSRSIGSRQEIALLPFSGVEIVGGDYHYVAENVLLFIPFGILLCMTLCAYGRKCSMRTILLVSFLTSLSVELMQFVFSCGKSETDDILTNVLGAVIGYAIIKPKRRE